MREFVIRVNDSEEGNSMEELIISVIDIAANGHVHHAGVQEKEKKCPIKLRIYFVVINLAKCSY